MKSYMVGMIVEVPTGTEQKFLTRHGKEKYIVQNSPHRQAGIVVEVNDYDSRKGLTEANTVSPDVTEILVSPLQGMGYAFWVNPKDLIDIGCTIPPDFYGLFGIK